MNIITNIINMTKHYVTYSKQNTVRHVDNDFVKIYNNITFSKILFTSKHSTVYTDIDNIYVLKEYNPYVNNHDYIKDEIKILKDLSTHNNSNIINLIMVSSEDDIYKLLFDRHGCDLLEYITLSPPTIQQLNLIIIELFTTVSFIHSLNIAHNDIKCENILIKDGHIKLCDFGYSSYMSDEYKIYKRRGTPHYISPDFFYNNVADGRLNDLWAVGIVICVVIYNIPFKKSTDVIMTYDTDPYFWANFNIEFNKYYFENKKDKCTYRFQLQILLKILLIKDENERYEMIKSYDTTQSNNLCDILINNHLFFTLINKN